MRSVIYVLGGAPATDERNFKRLRASRAELEPSTSLSEFKRLVREQFFILKLDREQALASLPTLLKGQSNERIDGYITHLEHVFAASGELSEHAAERFEQVKALFDKARPKAVSAPAAKASGEAENASVESAKTTEVAPANAAQDTASDTAAKKALTSSAKPAKRNPAQAIIRLPDVAAPPTHSWGAFFMQGNCLGCRAASGSLVSSYPLIKRHPLSFECDALTMRSVNPAFPG